MLVAAEEFPFRGNTLTFRQMCTAMDATNHILLPTERLFNMLLHTTQVTPYSPEDQHANEDEEYQSTQ